MTSSPLDDGGTGDGAQWQLLDHQSITNVLSFLGSATDLCSCQGVCKELGALARSEALWMPLLSERFGLNLQASPAVSGQQAYKALHTARATKKYPVRFHALYTDGGIDDNNAVYWVDNMYTPNAWGAYCSEVSPNVNTLALLKGPQCWHEGDEEAAHRAFLIDRLAAPTLQLFARYHLMKLASQMRKLALRPSPPRAMGTRSKTLKDLNNLNLMALGAGMAAIAADAAAAAGGAGAGEESMEGVMVVAGTPSPRACLLTPGRGTRGATNAEVPSSAMSSPVRAPADHDEMHMGIPPPDPSAAMHRGMRELLREEFAEQRDLIREEFSRGMAALAARVTETEARVAGVIAAVATLDARITSKFAQADVAFGPLLRLVPELSVAKDGVADLDERMGRMEKHEVLALAQFHVDQGKSREMAAKVAALTEQVQALEAAARGGGAAGRQVPGAARAPVTVAQPVPAAQQQLPGPPQPPGPPPLPAAVSGGGLTFAVVVRERVSDARHALARGTERALTTLLGPHHVTVVQARVMFANDHKSKVVFTVANEGHAAFIRARMLLPRERDVSVARSSECDHEMGSTVRRALRNWSTSGLERFYLALFQMMQLGVWEIGTLLRAGLPDGAGANDTPLLAAAAAIRRRARRSELLGLTGGRGGGEAWRGRGRRLLERSTLSDLQRHMNDVLRLPTGNGSGASSSSGGGRACHVALVRDLAVSRSGDFTCPVRAGAILMGCLLPAGQVTNSARARAAADWSAWDQLSSDSAGGAPARASAPAAASAASAAAAAAAPAAAVGEAEAAGAEAMEREASRAAAAAGTHRDHACLATVGHWVSEQRVIAALDGLHDVSEVVARVRGAAAGSGGGASTSACGTGPRVRMSAAAQAAPVLPQGRGRHPPAAAAAPSADADAGDELEESLPVDVLPRILQYVRRPNGEWVEFEPPSHAELAAAAAATARADDAATAAPSTAAAAAEVSASAAA
ncbi:hypothetical protein FOA52_014342 [Chlamydomonas sp. UWO 241]|nr:hypothetical protein FOA52_014342 [Chlamydomonas sp. UWO 241]